MVLGPGGVVQACPRADLRVQGERLGRKLAGAEVAQVAGSTSPPNTTTFPLILVAQNTLRGLGLSPVVSITDHWPVVGS